MKLIAETDDSSFYNGTLSLDKLENGKVEMTFVGHSMIRYTFTLDKKDLEQLKNFLFNENKE